jgi:PAS domain S-box-containing protein
MNRMFLFSSAIPTPVFWLDSDKVYRGCNQIFADLIGLNSPKDIVGLKDKALSYSIEDLDNRDSVFNSILSNQTQAKILYDSIVDFEGKIIWVQKRFTPLKNRNGKIIGIFGSVIDISEKVNRRKEMDTYLEHKKILGSLLDELNTTPILSIKYKELIEKSIVNLQKESEAILAVIIKEKALSAHSFLRFSTQEIDAKFLFENRKVFFSVPDQSGYLDEEAIKLFQDIIQPIKSIFYYRIRLNDFVMYDEVILLINPHKEKLESSSIYLALTQHIIHYFYVSRFMATAKQLSQHIKNTNNISSDN